MRHNIPFLTLILARVVSAVPLDESNRLHVAASELEGRQILPPPNCSPSTVTRKHGNGNPKKKFLHKQVTNTHKCGDGGCTLEQEQSKSYTIEWSASIGDPKGFFSAGFSVSESITTGQTVGCVNRDGVEDQALCIWWSIAHTEYEVQDWEVSRCGSGEKPKGDVYKITAPNKDPGDNTSYCVRNEFCRGNGDQYWASN